MKNSEYWERRIANTTWETYNSLEEKNRALLEMYQEASLSISDELYRLAEKMQTSIPTLSDMHKRNRLTALQKNIENIIGELGEEVEKFYIDNTVEGFKSVYENIMVQLGETEFAEVPKKLMEQIMRKQWEGSNFSTRLWKNTQVLANNLKDIITNGLIQGKTITEMAIQLNNAMNTGFNVSHRLIRTETMHYLNESAKKAYANGGCEEVQVWAAVDERTCDVCGEKHGNVYRINDCPTLPLHANCRCTILPIVDKDDAKKEHDKAKKDINNEFNRRNIPEEKVKDKMKRNYDSDKKQYKKYKEILGKDMDKSFDKFQELKYNNTKEWELVKDYVKSRSNNMISAFTSYSQYKEYKNIIDTDIIGLTTSNGIRIKKQSKHFIERVFGTSKDPNTGRARNGVEINDIKDALLNGMVRIRKTDPNSIKLITDRCMVSINPNTGVLIQTNP
ncbi:MAG: minor capsid protein [Clostridium sp.]